MNTQFEYTLIEAIARIRKAQRDFEIVKVPVQAGGIQMHITVNENRLLKQLTESRYITTINILNYDARGEKYLLVGATSDSV